MKKFFSLFLIFVLLFSLASCKASKNLEKYTDYSFDYFDTVTTIIGFEESEKDFNDNCTLIKKQLEEYHKLYTIYTKYDNLNNLATINEAHKELVVDKKIIDMIAFGKEMYQYTNGYLNIAMGSVLSIWHNYREEGLNNPEKAKLPPMDTLKKASENTNIEDIKINIDNNTIYLSNPNMTIDVGAVAKGYAVEQTALWMQEKGLNSYILNVGGNVRIVGPHPENKTWKVGIENPVNDDSTPYIEYLNLTDTSLVTSGSYQRFYTVDGKNYHHIINPKTLMPSEYFDSVSVLCKNSAKADALSTSLFSMPIEEGKKIVEADDEVEALWIMKDGSKVYSKNFKKYCD